MRSACEDCRLAFDGQHDNDKLASIIEKDFPKGVCEACSVSINSPGPVRSEETIHWFVVDPRDYDKDTRQIALTSFKRASKNGLSILRDCASNEDVVDQVEDILPFQEPSPPKTVDGVCSARVADVRAILDADGEQVFCVYDHTVPRRNPEHPPVATHGSILQRRPPRGDKHYKQEQGKPSLKELEKQYQLELLQLFQRTLVAGNEFRDGILSNLNARAQGGGYALSDISSLRAE